MENQEFNNTIQHAQEAAVPMKPKTWLTESILVTIIGLCCCIPAFVGIVSIVFASKVNNLYLAGQYEEAEQASKKAKMWALITLGVLAVMILYFFVSILIQFGSVGAFIEAIREQIQEQMELMENGGGLR